MGRNKNIRNRIAGLEQAIAAHEKKIKNEEAKPNCNMKRIGHWRGEIDGWKKQIERLTERLRRR
jgi:peptidoglycan hydrolase CwlO-like protein